MIVSYRNAQFNRYFPGRLTPSICRCNIPMIHSFIFMSNIKSSSMLFFIGGDTMTNTSSEYARIDTNLKNSSEEIHNTRTEVLILYNKWYGWICHECSQRFRVTRSFLWHTEKKDADKNSCILLFYKRWPYHFNPPDPMDQKTPA